MIHKYKRIEHILIAISFVVFSSGIVTFYLMLATQTKNTRIFEQIQLLKEVAKDIVYHDEVLTMSARINILDDKSDWYARYRQHADLLDQALAKAKSNQVPIDALTAALQQTNQALILIEESAFELVRSNQKDAAIDLLFGDSYEQQKQRYSITIAEIVHQIYQSESRLKQEYQGRERLFLQFFIIVVIGFLILLLFTYLVKKVKDKQIEQLIQHDPLTSLLNRRAFDQALVQEFMRCKREQRTIAIAIMDVDNFKSYNDIYGHSAGDEALRQVGKVLKDATRRSTEFAFRIGGEEFVMLASIAEASEAEAAVSLILEAIQRLNIPHNGNQPYNKVTMSIGLAIVSADSNMPAKDAYTRADKALYQAKNAGRNGIKIVSI